MDGFSGMLSYNVVIGTELKRKSEEEKTDLPEAKQNVEIDTLLGARANFLSSQQRSDYLRNR
ncbi:MAG: hypothetical protein IJZ00_11190 [Lachnospiraceae bacterium]|nr:hypothetical protein [Lachnospiraceae bacterium]